tara:strand:+ start:2767 stop:4074 length:1308 start_codon:yes stop_codon:yes gene_type:complete
LDDSLYQKWSRDQQHNVAETVTQTRDQAITVSSHALQSPASLNDLIAAALAHNPALSAARHRIDQTQHVIPQVSSLDDPMLTITPVGKMAQTADGEMTAMGSISQKFPLSGRLDTHKQIAVQQVNITKEQLRQTQLELIRDVKHAYWNLQLANQTLEVLTAQKQLMQQFSEAANASYRAGRSNQEDLLRINVEISTLDNRVLASEQTQQSVIARINTLLNRPAALPLQIKSDVQPNIIEQPLESWLKQMLQNSPQLQTIHHRIAQARKQLKLAHQQRIPDLTVMLNYAAVADHGTSMAANGNDQLYAGFGINLPIWQDKLDAAEQQALATIRQRLSELIAEHNQLQFAITDMHARVHSQRKQDTLYQETILPQTQQVLDSALSQYRAGRGGFLNLIDNWQKLLDLQLMSHRNQTQLQQDYAQLQFLAAVDSDTFN